MKRGSAELSKFLICGWVLDDPKLDKRGGMMKGLLDF